MVSDAYEGLKAAANRVLGATAQHCRVHLMRNAMVHAGKNQCRVVSVWIGTAFAENDATTARQQWWAVADQLCPKVQKLVELIDKAEADVLAYMGLLAASMAADPLTAPGENCG